MSTGLVFEINLMIRHYAEKHGEMPTYLIVSNDYHSSIRKSSRSELAGMVGESFHPDEQETCMGMIIATCRGKGIMKVAGC